MGDLLGNTLHPKHPVCDLIPPAEVQSAINYSLFGRLISMGISIWLYDHGYNGWSYISALA